MMYTFVMERFEENPATGEWEQETLITIPNYTEKRWQESVVDARSFFEEIGGEDVVAEKHHIEYMNPSRDAKVIYTLQNTEMREAYIDNAVSEVLKDNTAQTIRALFSTGRQMNWGASVSILNRTTEQEIERAIERVTQV